MIRKSTGTILSIAAAAFLAVFIARDTAEHRDSRPATPQAAVQGTLPVAERAVQHRSENSPVGMPTVWTSPASRLPEVQDADRWEPPVPGAKADRAMVVRRYGERPLTRNHPSVAPAIEIQERNTEWLMANPAVVGTAVGLNDEGEIALVVCTKVDAPGLPPSVEGLPVVVWQSGEFTARYWRSNDQDAEAGKAEPAGKKPGGPGGPPAPPSVDPRAEFPRPVPIGVSTGHFSITAGTIGCRVKDSLGAFYALSNNHVYANENSATAGDNVLQPGPVDGGTNPVDRIGTLSDFEPIVFTTSASNSIDAAIALEVPGSLGNATPSNGYGRPKSAVLGASLSLPVMKYGRTTVQTSSSVAGINATVNIGYDHGTARFVGQILIGGRGFSAGGDSGSLIVCSSSGEDHRKSVGLLFAGSKFSTIANPIAPVLARFNVVIDGE
jgi:hypothetical protein